MYNNYIITSKFGFNLHADPNGTLKDYRMTRVIFGISASSFAANMAVLQNASDHSSK